MKAVLTSQSFDAIVINGKMPGSQSVPETHAWIIENSSALAGHILFTFASVAEAEVRNFLEQKNIPFLVKPFEIGDLIANARRLLTRVKAAGAS
jgi:DNA-binding response OmpR family regulator